MFLSQIALSKPHCFSDSTVALFWIQGVNKTWKPFVQNRAVEIWKLLPPDSWMHCSGRDNPADIPSRGHTPKQLVDSQLWMNGPDWLKTGELSSHVDLEMPEECRVEMKVDKTHELLTTAEPSEIGQIMKEENFSSLSHLFAVTAIVLKFCRLLINKIQRKEGAAKDDLIQAEALWVIESQQALVKNKHFGQWKKTV